MKNITHIKNINSVLLTVSMIFFTIGLSNAQDNITFNKNVSLPGDGGTTVMDILYSDSMLYLYSPQKILELNPATNAITRSIDVIGTYGKYAPPFFFKERWIADTKLMAYNNDDDVLYYVSPDLNIYGYDLDQDQNRSLIGTPDSIRHFGILSGYSILKYDSENQRLFWLVYGSDEANGTGSFHSGAVYLGIYTVSNNGMTLTEMYSDFNRTNTTPNYNNSIADFEINTDTNLFYLSRKRRVEAWQITDNHQDSVKLVTTVSEGFGKASKMLYINHDNIHKVLDFPYRLPFEKTGTTPPFEDSVNFYVMDANDFSSYDTVLSPSRRIIDAAYVRANKTLVLCFAPDTMSFVSHQYDVAIYRYDAANDKFVFRQYVQTNTSISETAYDASMNYPIRLLPYKNDSVVLLSKVNEVGKIHKSVGQGYTYSSLYEAEGNHFGNSVFAGSKPYFINQSGNGVLGFNSSLTEPTYIQTAFAAYHTVVNDSTRMLYIYNNLNNYNNHIFVYSIDGDSIAGKLDIDYPIGEIVYNPFTKQMLVSANSGLGGKIYCYNANDALTDSISISGVKHIKNMLVAPNGKLYVASNMQNLTPEIHVYDAEDYDAVFSETLLSLAPDSGVFTSFNADFCYNPYNQYVYAVIGESNPAMNPYFSSRNSCLENGHNSDNKLPALLLKIKDSVDSMHGFNGAREIICATPNNPPGGYTGKLFINSSKNSLSGSGLLIYDVANLSMDSVDLDLLDITYNPVNNELYGFTDDSVTGSSDRIAKVISIDSKNSSNQLTTYEGQASALFYNPYDAYLYFQTKFDNTKKGTSPAYLIQLDLDNPDDTTMLSLQNTSFYVDLDNYPTDHLYFNNLSTPYVAPYANKMFLPNGAHSNMSIVEFSGFLPLELDSGSNWISIPRLEGNLTTAYMESDSTKDVFNANRFDLSISTLDLEHNRVNGEGEQDFTSEWSDEPSKWSFDPNEADNRAIFSYRGYILEMTPDTVNKLEMKGQIKDPDTKFPIYEDKKNWIGYFLLQEQDVFDALADHLDIIYEIWHRTYYCYRPNGGGIIFGPEGGGVSPPSGPEWACSNSSHRIKYGEMIKVNPSSTDTLFYWSTGDQSTPNDPRQSASYYTYTEKSSYKPIIIELDTTSNPEEIGAFMNDTCIGACSVIESDTAVILMAYLDGQPADSIEFREYSSTKSASKNWLEQYSVLDEKSGIYEKRKLHSHEGNRRAFVSFKHREVSNETPNTLRFNIWPNPTTDKLYYSCILGENSEVIVSIYDMSGKILNTQQLGQTKSGFIQGSLKLKTNHGDKLKPGIYFVKMSAGHLNKTKKLIVQ